jgi:large subunit ribosomal protein L9
VEIILQESIKTLGKAGDVVKVADGYARNYLLPRGLALVADKKNLTNLERQRNRILARAAKLREEYEALASQLQSMELVVPAKVGEGNRLYGSVTAMDIAELIAAKGYQVDKRKIQIQEPIKAIGEYDVEIRLATDVTAIVKVKVVPQVN